jgi:5-methyltetrahydropteroyltriglutamate--homocysteine methyltransferase
MQAFAPGIYPRSEALVRATRDLDRGRTTPEAVDEQFDADLEQLVEAQRGARLDLLSDGMLRWQDLFRPLLEASDGLETGALTRFLDTNTFFRAPRAASAAPKLTEPLGEPYIVPLPGPRLVTLPSPFALALGTGLSPIDVAEGVLRPQIDALETDLVVLSEPFLARADDVDLDELSSALDILADGPPVVLQLTVGDAQPLLEQGVGQLPIEGIGVDFYATQASAIPVGFGKLLVAGVVDARSSALEEAEAIAAFAASLHERGVGEIALAPNGDLQFVSEPIARQKLFRLAEAARLRTEEHGWASRF